MPPFAKTMPTRISFVDRMIIPFFHLRVKKTPLMGALLANYLTTFCLVASFDDASLVFVSFGGSVAIKSK